MSLLLDDDSSTSSRDPARPDMAAAGPPSTLAGRAGPARILFSTVDGIGHFHPLLPLARELRRLGHAVAFLAPASIEEAITAEGFLHLAAGPAIHDLVTTTFARRPSLAATGPQGHMRAAITAFADLRVELTLPPALAMARMWRPEMVISEHADFVGPLVAALLGAQQATLGFGPGHPEEWLAEASEAVAPHYIGRGLSSPDRADLYQGLYLDTCPTALQAPGFHRPTRVLPLRPEAYRRPDLAWSAPDLDGLAGRPLILLTMGTIFAGSG